MFSSVLVANRGEIACRIIGTLQKLGIRSVAVYTEADRGAKHVALADSAVLIDSYLSVSSIVTAASGADAVHPGYGFLSENAELAIACAAQGIVFVGPGIEALEIMGDKIRAKAHVVERGVPVIAGVAEPGMTDADLVKAAAGVGYPLLIKPSAGGGGKGMTVVRRQEDLPEALAGARRVAASAFGDDSLFLERLVETPRHIEVQVLADAHGTTIHLGERECSLQRRHQKIIEEAPSPLLDAATRERIGEAACEVARSVSYVGAGTVEFLVSDAAPDDFFFMEMNTRLQVEHPVTELVTGIDLVEWQLRIAAGEPLDIGPVTLTGHAIEARVYSEDPQHDFLPSAGTVLALHEPTNVRVDSSLVDGLVVSPRYDPMLAKVIAHGATRAEALSRLDAALAETVVLGVHTNVEFLRALLADEGVRAGRLDTGLIERALPGIRWREADAATVAAAALTLHARNWRGTEPWHRPTGWRLGVHRPTRYSLSTGDVFVQGSPEHATVDGISARLTGTTIEYGGTSRTLEIAEDGDTIWIGDHGSSWEFTLLDRATRMANHRATLHRVEGAADPDLRSPMPGTVVAVHVATGDTVEEGQPIVTIEAMKMEHPVLASMAGTVEISLSPGNLVTHNQVVARISPPQEASQGAQQ